MKTDIERFWERNSLIVDMATKVAYTGLGIELTGMAIVIARLVIVAILPALSMRCLWLTGTSIEPTQGEGDLIVIDTSVTLSDLDYGDVIVFEADPSFGWSEGAESICHRVFAFTPDGSVITHGDHNARCDDQLIGEDALIGREALILPHMGWLVRTDVMCSFALCIAAACVAAMAYYASYKRNNELIKVWPTYAAFCARRDAIAQLAR